MSTPSRARAAATPAGGFFGPRLHNRRARVHVHPGRRACRPCVDAAATITATAAARPRTIEWLALAAGYPRPWLASLVATARHAGAGRPASGNNSRADRATHARTYSTATSVAIELIASRIDHARATARACTHDCACQDPGHMIARWPGRSVRVGVGVGVGDDDDDDDGGLTGDLGGGGRRARSSAPRTNPTRPLSWRRRRAHDIIL